MTIQYKKAGLTVFESALYRTTSTVLEWGNEIVIIDPNWLPNEVQFIRDFVDGKYKNVPKNLLFTHSDYDHIIGYGAFPEATTIAEINFVNNPMKKNIVQQILDFDDQYYIQRPYKIEYPRIDKIITKNKTTLESNGEEAIFYPVAGHVNNGLCVVFPSRKLCVVGDYLCDIEIPMVEFSFEKYAETLDLLKNVVNEFQVETCITGHGNIALGQQGILHRIQVDLLYLHGMLSGLDASNSLFEKTIQTKGNILQNRIIHQNNCNLI
ncbi:MAG: MBL fold metallo-hydrolase [Saprospiraceae bacterium]